MFFSVTPARPCLAQTKPSISLPSFSQRLYRELGSEKGNLCFSPYSINEALAMTSTGAAGETARQLQAIVGFSSDVNETNRRQSELKARLNALNAQGFELNIANSVWPEKSFLFRSEYIATLKNHYDTLVEPQDFKSNAESSRKTINSWVSKKTKEKIKNLISPGALNTDTRMVLVNAIYLKAQWLEKFKATSTIESNFNLQDGGTQPVQMMNRTGPIQ